MAKGNRSAVDVDFLSVKLKLTNALERLRSERFVQLDKPDVINGQAGAAQRFARRKNRTDSHYGWFNAGDG